MRKEIPWTFPQSVGIFLSSNKCVGIFLSSNNIPTARLDKIEAGKIVRGKGPSLRGSRQRNDLALT